MRISYNRFSKVSFLLILFSTLLINVSAQQMSNRIVIHGKDEIVNGFLTERIDSITFPKVEGRIAADIIIQSVTKDSLLVDITRTKGCKRFKMVCLSEDLIIKYTTNELIRYIEQNSNSITRNKDYINGIFKDPNWKPNSRYVLATVGYDLYNTACSLTTAPFKTPKETLIGTPKVNSHLDSLTQRLFIYTFAPNQDVAGYAIYAAVAGTAQKAYEENKEAMGLHEFGDLICEWGTIGNKGSKIQQIWNGMEPNTEYEIFIQAWDINGTLAPCDTVKIRTKSYGNTGIAEVTVSLGEYKLSQWGNHSLHSQIITYIPNDQTACYRFDLILKSEYEKNPNTYKYKLAKDPPFPMENWFFYEELTTDYQIDPNIEYVILTAAKNSKGEWSKVKAEYHKTPSLNNTKILPHNNQVSIKSRQSLNTTFYKCYPMNFLNHQNNQSKRISLQ